MLTFSCNFLKGFCKGEGRADVLRAINRVHSVKLHLRDGWTDMTHTGWQQLSLMYISEHITACTVGTSCYISHGPSQWEREIFDPPQLGDPWTDFHET